MATSGESLRTNPEIEELRLLTEVDHLLSAMQQDGSVPPDVREDVATNLQTAVYEIAMPSAVSNLIHRVEYRDSSETGRQERIITWLGKSAVESALGGKQFHFSEAAHKRVDIEVAEAQDAELTIAPGRAKVFISPKMSTYDAPEAIARQEHLLDDDSVRVSYAVTNSAGEVIARRMQSLLVRDIPLEAWVCMLKDPRNMFGRAFSLSNEQSALSVMELFKELDLPEELLPEGPVTLVESVLPYIFDVDAHDSVSRQLVKFREDQTKYESQAKKSAQDWLEFDTELAKSLMDQVATYDVQRFIAVLQLQWSDADRRTIRMHELEGGDYYMTRELAAVLEKAKRYILGSDAALAIGNETVLAQAGSGAAEAIRDQQELIGVMKSSGYASEEIAAQQAQLARLLAGQNFALGGGCAGIQNGNFGPRGSSDRSSGADKGDGAEDPEAEDKETWGWTVGTCRIKSCPKPNPTLVGPCAICKHCQAEFDAGRDPTIFTFSPAERAVAKTVEGPMDVFEQLLAEFNEREQRAEELLRSIGDKVLEVEEPKNQKQLVAV